MSTDSLFPKHWGLQNTTEELEEGNFPTMPLFPDVLLENEASTNYLNPLVQAFEFSTIASWEIADSYFYKLPQHKIGKNIQWIKEPECRTEIDPKTIWIYRESNKKNGYQTGKDELIYTIKIYISTNNAKLKKLYDCMKQGAADDEILFFMEDNTDDLSDQSLYVRFGNKVDKDFLLKMSNKNLDFIAQNMPDFDKNKLRELISTGEVKASITPLRALLNGALQVLVLTGAVGKALGWLSEQIGEAVELLMIPESLWDSKSEDYFLKKENVVKDLQFDTSLLKQWQQRMEQSENWRILAALSPVVGWMPQILDSVQNMVKWYNIEVLLVVNLIYERREKGVEQLDEFIYLSEQIAFLCGLWNGLVDFVAGIFKFLGTLLQVQYDIAQNFQAVLEAIDDFREAWEAFSFADFFETAWQLLGDMLDELSIFLNTPNPRENYNFDRIAYTGGFGFGFIASFFLPLINLSKVSAIAKFSKFIPEEFVSSLNIAKVQELKGSKALIKWLEEVTVLLGKKGDEMYQELKKLLDKVLDWIKKNSKRFESTLSKVREAFFKEGKTEEYFRKIEKKFNLAGEQILSTYNLKILRRLLKETFDVPLELVDQTPKLKGKLKDWTARRVAGSFNMVEGVMYLRKSVTAYTVQHEMFHMKLWYKMTREFPELQPLFQKTLGRENVLFHEEYVLSEFMKDSSKWLEVDLLNDLENINGLRTQKGLQKVDLEYYKKWKLEEELLKFE